MPPAASPEARNQSATSQQLIDLVMAHGYADLPPAAVAAAKMFLADTLAVGVAGAGQPGAARIAAAMAPTERGCGVLGRAGLRLAPYDAALVNGFQIHCLEWDGLHEPSVVIALCVTTAALVCEAQIRPVSGRDLLAAFVTGVETAVFFGAGATSGPRFFRPSAAGLMGAAMAIGRARGFDRGQMLDLLGLAYSQVGGTMQAHWEGSEALALQVGFAARAALTAADLVLAGMRGPHDVVDGKFGYFRLIETADDLAPSFARWGKPWKVTELAHKPFPAGRATQAALTAILDMRREAQFGIDAIERLEVRVPPLIDLLVGRPYDPAMSAEYARLCMQFVAPQMLEHGKIDPCRFTPATFASAAAREHAARVQVVLDDNPDPNALSPQTVVLRLKDGRQFERHVSAPLGSPGNPLSHAEQIAKARFCFELGGIDLPAEALFDGAERLDSMAEAGPFIALLT